MTARTVTPDQLEAIAASNGSVIEFAGDLGYTTVNGVEYVAVLSEVTC